MRILIVEDDRDLADILLYTLESLGHQPYVAVDVEAAAKILPAVKPNIVLLDMLINGQVSTPFIQVVRQANGSKSPRIVILSAMRGADKVAKANDVDFLPKPFELDALQRLIENKNPEER